MSAVFEAFALDDLVVGGIAVVDADDQICVFLGGDRRPLQLLLRAIHIDVDDLSMRVQRLLHDLLLPCRILYLRLIQHQRLLLLPHHLQVVAVGLGQVWLLQLHHVAV